MPNLTLPPFLSRGDSGAVFYTLAYCRGTYGIRQTTPGVFLTLDYTTSPDFTRYSVSVRDTDGKLYLYSRGDDVLDSLEYVLLNAQNEYAIPPAYWQLYPIPIAAQVVWPERPEDRDPYNEARGRLRRILWRFRVHEHFRSQGAPLFELDPTFVPPSLFDAEPHGDAIEILSILQEEAEKSGSDRDD